MCALVGNRSGSRGRPTGTEGGRRFAFSLSGESWGCVHSGVIRNCVESVTKGDHIALEETSCLLVRTQRCGVMRAAGIYQGANWVTSKSLQGFWD